jgi:hypothetical protein
MAGSSNVLVSLADVVEVLDRGEDDKTFGEAANIFLAELRREATKRGFGDWSMLSLLLALEDVLRRDEDLDNSYAAAVKVVRERLTLAQHAQASMN